jgi:predicted ATPase
MEITKIVLTNIRCFEHIEIDLKSEDETKNWLVIIGNNGVGKTTLLRSIALGLCEESGAAGLLSEISEMLRYNTKKGVIRIEIKPNPEYDELAYIETTLTRNEYDEVELNQKVSPRQSHLFNWEDLFACAYGVGRGVFGSDDVSEYAVTDSVYSLFNYKSELQNPELVLRRIQAETNSDELLRKTEKILMLPANAIQLGRKGITINNYYGSAMPISNMADGYSSTITWILDMYGWKLLYEEHLQDIEIRGIVLIDEIENHLHPKWQKQIIKLLSEQFPNVQFIITTHSPICVVGTTDLVDQECLITILKYGENGIVAEFSEPLRDKRVDQILTSYLFGLSTSGDNKIKNDIERYYELSKTVRNDKEDDEMQKLSLHLQEVLGSAETELERKVGAVLNKSLEMLFEEEVQKDIQNESPEKFELLRQLKELL